MFTDVLGGISDDTGFKSPCRVATTADLGTSLTGLPVIDGVQLASGDRVLVWRQTDQTTNGIYVAASGAWSRAIDFSSSAGIVRGTQVYVSDGTTSGGVSFVCLADYPTVGTTAITFTPGGGLSAFALNSLPTSDPLVLGAPWNDGGVFAISKGP